MPLYTSSPSVSVFDTIKLAAGLEIASLCAVVIGASKTPFVVLTTSITADAAGSLVVPTARPVPILCVAEYSSAVPAALTLKIDFAEPKDVNPVPPFATGNVPVTPVDNGNPVQFINAPADGVPMFGVVRAGEVANTSAPDPVSSVIALARFALDGVAKKVAIPVPRPDTPVEIGSPVQFISTPADGVPRFGVTSVGDALV